MREREQPPTDAGGDAGPRTRSRARRPALERDHPIRHFAQVFGPGERGRPREAGSEKATDRVSRAVELGYRVIDEYIRQGQKAARRVRAGRVEAETLQADVEELGMRVAQHASDLAALLGEAFTQPAGGEAPAEGSDASSGEQAAGPTPRSDAQTPPRPAPAPSHGEGAALRLSRVRIFISSRQPAEVSVDLEPQLAGRPLLAHALRTATGEAPIRAVRFEPSDPEGTIPPTVRVEIPPDQPAGTYHGLLIDPDTDLPAGTLRVRIEAAPS